MYLSLALLGRLILLSIFHQLVTHYAGDLDNTSHSSSWSDYQTVSQASQVRHPPAVNLLVALLLRVFLSIIR